MPRLDFAGKHDVDQMHRSLPVCRLRIHASLGTSPDPSPQDNLVIEGDNLLALRSLIPRYDGQIDFIYIDPPYNTGATSWVYNDNAAAEELKTWLTETVGDRELSKHDRWLCMMTPRLRLLSGLLGPEGVIAVSIDHNEVHHLIVLMNEIFGEENHRDTVIIPRGVKSVQEQFDTIGGLANGYESVLIYTKNPEKRFHKVYETLPAMKPGTWNNHWRGTERPTMRYPLFGIIPERGQWRWSEERSARAASNYEALRSELGNSPPPDEIDRWYARRLSETGEKPDLLRLSATGKPEHYVAPTDKKLSSNLWLDIRPGGSREVAQIFGSVPFDNPKPVALIRRLMEFAGIGGECTILDSFAGSGSTGHAVMEANAEDGGARRFILIESKEYANTITAERIRRIARGIPGAADRRLRDGIPGTFTYCTLEQ
jgi:adenine-specific DNA-methyltransferase